LIERGRQQVTILDRQGHSKHRANVINLSANASHSPSPDLYVIKRRIGNLHYRRTSNIRSQCRLDGRIGSAEAFRLLEWISDAAVGVLARRFLKGNAFRSGGGRDFGSSI